MHYAETDQFRLIQIRQAMAEKKLNGRHVDERIQRVVTSLNACRGTATAWSCSGHTRGEKKDPEYKKTRAYIVFAISGNKADYVIRTISDWIMRVLSDKQYTIRPALIMTALRMEGITDVFTHPHSEHNGTNYPCWSIEIKTLASPGHVRQIQSAFDTLANMLDVATSIEIDQDEE